MNDIIIIFTEREKNHFEVLPEGWVSVIHESGMPVYLHKPTRVCTLAKPYFIGAGSVRVRTEHLAESFQEITEFRILRLSFNRNLAPKILKSLIYTHSIISNLYLMLELLI